LKKFYSDRNSIPIPSVIAVSKWDNSPSYQSENEVEKAIEYIEQNTFFKLAKEKIERNFLQLKIIPLSAIGKSITDIEPYNIEKPIEFFLNETYAVWVKKIESLKNNPKEQFIFLSKVNYDMKHYDKNQYDILYKKLEREFSQKIFEELKIISNIEEYYKFEKRNQKIIKALSSANRNNILEKKNQLLKEKKNKSKLTSLKIFIILSILGVGVYFLWKWKIKEFFIKNESELFIDIEAEYKMKNYEDALDDITDYMNVYSEKKINLKHKNRVIEIKTIIKREQIISNAKRILSDINFENINEIEELCESFSSMNIDKPKLFKELMDKKNKILWKSSFNEFRGNCEKKNFNDAINFVERNWKSDFGEKNKAFIIRILNKKINDKIEKLLKSISDVYDIDEYQNLLNTLKKITLLKDNSIITKIDYTPSIQERNQKEIDNKNSIKNEYQLIVEKGISGLTVSFLATDENNEPLGFKCQGEDEIILTIDSKIYHFDDEKVLCEELKISWSNSEQIFKAVSYNINVTEEDIADNDHYDNHSIKLSKDDLIKLYREEEIKKELGSGYFIELKKER
jgi:hypothetical protein